MMYEKPSMDIIILSQEDVITTSVPGPDPEGGWGELQ